MTMPSLSDAKDRLRDAEEEQAYWDAHYDELLAHHREQFVAVKDAAVVAAESDLAQLMLALAEKHIDIRATWVRYVTADHSNLIL